MLSVVVPEIGYSKKKPRAVGDRRGRSARVAREGVARERQLIGAMPVK